MSDNNNKVSKVKNVNPRNLISSKYAIGYAFVTLLLISLPLSFYFYYYGKIFPGIYIASIYVGGNTPDEAKQILAEKIAYPQVLAIEAKNTTFDLSLDEIEAKYNFDKSAENAFLVYRSSGLLQNLLGQFSSLRRKSNLPLEAEINEDKLDEYVDIISSQVLVEPTFPSVTYIKGTVSVEKGKPGESVNKDEFKNQLKQRLVWANFLPISVPFDNQDPSLTDDEVSQLKARAEKYIGKNINLTFDRESHVLTDSDILGFIDAKVFIDEDKILKSIQENISPKFNREAQNAVFRFENGKVMEFLPAKDGVIIDEDKLKRDISEKIAILGESEEKSQEIIVPAKTSPPAITTEEVNSLGIKKLIGRGTSTFRGSIPSRVHNISLASSKFNGILIPPETVFSFNDALGDVSTFTGYKQAYIIRDGQTVLGDGGGVCQVSTTLFRALLDAGLPIVERRAHSYRVSYYEQDSAPGLDATVFSPTTDLKFKNDTPGHLLVQTQFDPNNLSLVFEVYGTDDGRISTTTKPVTVSSTAPPEDLYIDDPNLPTGQIKQIDFKAWGAKVVFNYKVERDGQVIYEKEFVSAYRPWQAKFLRGTGPVQ